MPLPSQKEADKSAGQCAKVHCARSSGQIKLSEQAWALRSTGRLIGSFAMHRWLAQLLANVGLKHPDPIFAEITEPTQPLPLPPPEQ